MQSSTFGAAEANLTVKVTRKDGSTEVIEGDAIIDHDALIKEYQQAVAYCRRLEALIADIPEITQRAK